MKWPVKDTSLKFPHIFLINSLAGSGKTEKLANRFIQFLLSENVPSNSISNILAITFTENAAKDMKKRIITNLKKIALSEKDSVSMISDYIDMDKKILIKRASDSVENILDNYSYFNISTIDSFILKMFESSVKNLGYAIDMDLEFNYSDIIGDAFSYFIHKALMDKKGQNLIDETIELINYSEKRFLIDPSNRIKENFVNFLNTEDVYLKDIKKPQERLFKHKEDIENKIISKLKKVINKENEKIFYTDIVTGFYSQDVGIISSKIAEKGRIFRIKNIDENMEKLSDELVSLSKEYLIIDSKTFYYPYILLYAMFKKDFDEYLKNNTSSFVLSRAVKDLNKYFSSYGDERIIEVYIKLSSFIKHFLIDEFQDTSYSQWSVLRPLIEDAISCDGSGFFIGDIKQAIYMFRNADYRIIEEFIEKPKANNRYIEISSVEKGIEKFDVDISYRSARKIIDYVNEFLSSAEFKNFCDGNGLSNFYKNYAIVHKADKEEDGYYENIIIEKDKENITPIEERLKSVFIKEFKDRVNRFGYSNIAILTYKNDMVEKLAGWVNELKFPVASYSSLDIRRNRIIASLISFLKFISDQTDNIAFFEFITSDIFRASFKGVKFSEIEDIFIEAKKNRIFPYKIFKQRYERIWEECFEKFIYQSGVLGVYELVSSIYRSFNLYDNFKSHASFLVKFKEVVFEKTLSDDYYSLDMLLSYIKDCDEDDESLSIDISDSVDAVKIMTFHKAKGLEFNCVINIFNKGRDNHPDNMYFWDDTDAIEVLRINKLAGESLSDLDETVSGAYKLKRTMNLISDINIVYVALTRAKDEILNIVVEPGENDILSVFKEGTCGRKRIFKTDRAKTKNIVFEVPQKDKITYPFIKKVDIDNEIKLRGKIYHSVFSMLEFSEDLKNLDEIIDKAFSMNMALVKENEKKEIKERIERLFEKSLFSGFFDRKEKRKVFIEKDFMDISGDILRPDRIIVDEDNIIIIDFKTGLKNPGYAQQIRRYMKLAEKFFGKKSVGYLSYIDDNLIEKVDL